MNEILVVSAESLLADDGKAVLTGETLFVLGCGRTDFQGGSSVSFYDSVYNKLFRLPDDVVVFPGHDNNNQTHSTIGNEKANNHRLRLGTTKEDFVNIMMYEHNFPKPKRMDIAVPANLKDGTNPFFVRSLRNRLKHRWGVFG
jgi:sulfur dioxygenase